MPTQRFLGDLVAETDGAQLVRGDAAAVCVSGMTQDTRRLAARRPVRGRAWLGARRPGVRAARARPWRRRDRRRAAARLVVRRSTCRSFLSATPAHALADLSAAFYGHPSRHLPVVGITGTDGKTSTTHLLSAILEAHGLRTGWLTTVNTKIGHDVRANAAEHTTPEAPVVQRTLAEMRAARPGRGHPGDQLARARPGARARRRLSRRRLHQPEPRAPQLPRLVRGVPRREAKTVRTVAARRAGRAERRRSEQQHHARRDCARAC